MHFKEWYSPTEFLEHALGGILAMNLQHRIDEGRKDPERLRQAKVTDRGDFQGVDKDIFWGGMSDDEKRAEEDRQRELHTDLSGKRRESDMCPMTPLSAYSKQITLLQNAAKSDVDKFAFIMMFSPLSANVNFAKHWDNVPVVWGVLKTLFPDKIKPVDAEDEQYKGEPDKILERWLLPFNTPKYGLGATIGGWKYKTIAYIWNNREQLKSELDQVVHGGGSDSDLIFAMKSVPGVKPVKAGFIAQLLYGRAGCIDTHNIDIYGRTFPDLKGELNDKLWQKYNKKKDTVTRATIDQYTGTLDKLKSRGIGTGELWDVWVDFVGRMYKAILPGGLYDRSQGPALNPNDPNYQKIKTTVPKERILATGKKDKGNFVGIDTISGDDSGGGASMTHDLPRHDPYDIIQQLYKHHRGDPDAADFTKSIIRQPKMMGPKPAAVHYFHPALDQDTGEVDPERMHDLVKGFGAHGVKRMQQKMMDQLRKKKAKEAKKSERGLFDFLPGSDEE